jgi:predicted phage terminase large subunit-like protein
MRIKMPPLHLAQAEIAKSDARFRVVCCGRRFGKTRLAVLLSLAEMLQGGAVMWIAPSYDKAMIGWRLFEELATQIPGIVIQRGNGRIERGAGWIAVRSADSEGGLRGEGLSLVVVDEAAHIRDLERIWQQELRPSLTDRKGRALFISTPHGFNFFYDLFRMADHDPDWKSWQFPSSANPFLDPAEIEVARRELPALVFRQEYGAEFVQLSGAMFRREWFEIVESVPSLTAQTRHWDLAATTKTTGDYSAGVKIGLAADGTAYILDMVHGRWEWPELLRVIGQTARSDGPSVTQTIETAGVQRGMLDLLRAEPALADIPFRGVSPLADKIARANTWLARAEQGKVKLLRGQWNSAWLDEICAFPEAEHDDIVDATSGAFAGLAMPYQIEYAESIWR